MSELSDSELVSTFIAMLKNEVGEILRVTPDKIDANRSIYDMGLDSLMGVELVVALEARFGTRLPVMALSQSPTITKLADRLIKQLKGGENAEAVSSDSNHLLAQAQLVAAQHGVEASHEFMTSLTQDIQSRTPASTRQIIR